MITLLVIPARHNDYKKHPTAGVSYCQGSKHINEPANEAYPTMSKQITAAEVKEHASPEKGLYIIIDNGVYQMSGFVDEHPGGAKILKRVGGKDASKQFWKVSRGGHNMGWTAR